MKIVLINHSDTIGGASVVTRRLMHALRDIGHVAYMLVGRRLSDDPYVIQAAPAWRTRIPFLAETARIYIDNGFNRDDLFKVSIATDGLPLSRHPLVRDADAIILAWVNQGLLSLDEIERIGALGRPLLWIMHDLWCATAICHHPATCTRYLRHSTHDDAEQGCHHCHMLHSRAAAKDASYHTWQRKKALYSNTPIRFVAVSTWLAEKCRQSSLMDTADIHVIPNAFPLQEFTAPPAYTRSDLDLPTDATIILMAAARLDDPIKNLPLALQALNNLNPHTSQASPTEAISLPDASLVRVACDPSPRQKKKDAPHIHAVFVGTLKNPQALDSLRIPYTHTGPVYDPERLRSLFAAADIILSTSHYETLPGTLIEGQAAGAYPIATVSGGQRDIITDTAEGLLVHPDDPAALTTALSQAIANTHSSEALRAAAARFDAQAIAHRITTLLQ